METNRIRMSQAYWIAPEGTIYTVPLSHINFMAEHTELFGITREEYLERYRLHNEKLGWEGKARRELMAEAIKRGWIRLRFVPKSATWTIELWEMNDTAKQNLERWAESNGSTMLELNHNLNILRKF
jgi:hypothetical protein